MQVFQLHEFVDQLVCRPFNYMNLWTSLYASLSITWICGPACMQAFQLHGFVDQLVSRPFNYMNL
jgi:hypothetical protein